MITDQIIFVFFFLKNFLLFSEMFENVKNDIIHNESETQYEGDQQQ